MIGKSHQCSVKIMELFKTEFETTHKSDIRYNFLLCVVFCQAISDLLKKLEPHRLSLFLLQRKKKQLDYQNFIGLITPRGDYYHCHNLFRAYHVSVPDEIYQIYTHFKATQTKLHSTFKSEVLDSNIENLLLELFDISYYEQFKIENLKDVLEGTLGQKHADPVVKI